MGLVETLELDEVQRRDDRDERDDDEQRIHGQAPEQVAPALAAGGPACKAATP
jgi:hypothetical protein